MSLGFWWGCVVKAFKKLKKLSLVASLILIPSLSFSVDNIVYADGFDYPMKDASDYVNGLGYNEKYSGYYTDSTNNTNFKATNKEPDICEEVGDFTCIDPQGTWKNVSDVGNYYSSYKLLHPAEDWNLLDGNDTGKEIHAIANGKVVMVETVFRDNTSQGYQLIIKHTIEEGNSFKYPSSDPSIESFTYDDIGNTVYSVYLHVTNKDQTDGTIKKPTIELNDIVNKGDVIGRIANTRLPHLHLEVRDGTEWNETESLYSNASRGYGYYESFEKMKKDGILDPSDFIQANLKITLAEPIKDSDSSSENKLPFTDVTIDDWYYPYVKDLFDKEAIIHSPTQFNPNEEISRSDFITMIILALVSEKDLKAVNNQNYLKFEDVSTKDEFHKYLNYAVYKEIINGNNTNFNPNDKIIRAEASKIVVKSIERILEENLLVANTSFTDVPDNEWFSLYVKKLKSKQVDNIFILTGYGDGTFQPAKNINKAEASKIISLSSKIKDN